MDTVALPPLLAESKGLNHLAFRPDGARLAVADTALTLAVRVGDRTLWSRSLASNEPKVAIVGRVHGLAFSPDGARLYALAPDGIVAFSADLGEHLWTYGPPRTLGFLVTSPMALAVRLDGLIAASFDNGAIGAWNEDGRLIGIWKDVDVQRRMAFLPDGRLLGDDSFGISVFDVESRKRVHRSAFRDRSYGLAVARYGYMAIRTLHEAWQMTPAGDVCARTPVGAGLPLLAYHPHEPLLALSAAHEVAVASVTGEVVARHPVEGTTVVSLAYSPDGRLFAGGADGSLILL